MTSTAIEWATSVWNPVTGCSKVSSGCAHCYAETMHRRFFAGKFTDVVLHPDRLSRVFRWRKPRSVFVNSMSDLFHADVPVDFIANVFAVMAVASQPFYGWRPGKSRDYGPHRFLVLTKRPARMRELLASRTFVESVAEKAYGWAHNRVDMGDLRSAILDGRRWPLPGVWLGVSIEDQATADGRVPVLLDTPAASRWVSAEPLLSRVDLYEHLSGAPWVRDTSGEADFSQTRASLDWVVVGGESGPGARPSRPEAIREVVRQCAEADVPVFVKQLGANVASLEGWPNWKRQADMPITGEQEWTLHDPQGELRGRIFCAAPSRRATWFAFVDLNEKCDDMVLSGLAVDLNAARADVAERLIQYGAARVKMRSPKGSNLEEWPPDLRVREVPA